MDGESPESDVGAFGIQAGSTTTNETDELSLDPHQSKKQKLEHNDSKHQNGNPEIGGVSHRISEELSSAEIHSGESYPHFPYEEPYNVSIDPELSVDNHVQSKSSKKPDENEVKISQSVLLLQKYLDIEGEYLLNINSAIPESDSYCEKHPSIAATKCCQKCSPGNTISYQCDLCFDIIHSSGRNPTHMKTALMLDDQNK